MQYKFSLVDRKKFTPEILVLFEGFCGCFFICLRVFVWHGYVSYQILLSPKTS